MQLMILQNTDFSARLIPDEGSLDHEIRMVPNLVRTPVSDPDRQGMLRLPASSGRERGTGPRSAEALCGTGERGRDGEVIAAVPDVLHQARGAGGTRPCPKVWKPRGRNVSAAAGPIRAVLRSYAQDLAPIHTHVRS